MDQMGQERGVTDSMRGAVAESADARVSKTREEKYFVWVQVPPAPQEIAISYGKMVEDCISFASVEHKDDYANISRNDTFYSFAGP